MSDVVQKLQAYCKENGERVTAPRQHVLEIISSADVPITAYDVLDKLADHLNKPKPPTVYRALEFLSDHGFVHRIESLNAYKACEENHRHNGSQFMICTNCGRVEEIHMCHMPGSVRAEALKKNFTPDSWSLELKGLCSSCHSS